MVCSISELIQSNQGKIEEDTIGYILQQIANALFVLHSNHRLHRDVKSENILISSDGTIKLANFRCAAQLFIEKNLRNTIIGTPVFMAPELALGNDYDEKIDIWSFGIIALHLAEGEIPNAEDSPVNIFLNAANDESPGLSESRRWSEEFKEVVNACLVKDPKLRISSEQLLSKPFLRDLNKESKKNFLRLIFESREEL